jgi:SAM-dependent methyltransferase
MKSKIKDSRISDLFFTVFLVVAFMIVFYLIPPNSFNIYTGTLMFLILVPTMMALVNGAPFVPTPMFAVEKILKLANIKPGEKVYDIGCGDGRMVYLAAKDYKADAVGFELSPLVYILARIRHFIWRSKAKIIFGNFKNRSLADADVIVCYLLPETNAKLEKKLNAELKKGTRIVSYAFQFKDWKEAHREPGDPKKNISTIWVYEK